MTARLRFAAFGPLRMWRDAEEVPVGSPQQQALLAALVLVEGRPVTVGELIRVVWHENPPRAALGTIRTYLSRLRRLLDGTGAEISALADSYRLSGGQLSADVWELDAAVTHAQQLLRAADPAGAARALDAVLAGSTGIPLAGVPGYWAETQRTRLADRRDMAAELRLTARLESAEPTAEDLADLARLVDTHPLREAPRALLMLALYRRGRQAEALEVFRQGHQLLRDELAVEPGPALQATHRRILRGDPSLIVVAPAPAPPSTPAPAVFLPAGLTHFVGRETELGLLRSALSGPGRVAVITGLSGSGRTSLALRAAHELAGSFPDGQLYTDLRDAGGIGGVLQEWLRMLGAGPDIPATDGGRVAMFSSLMAGRRLLLVVDNATDTTQVSLLRRAAPRATLLITSARRLTSVPEANWIRLGGFRLDDSLGLITAVAGRARVLGEPAAAARLAELCGGHPLGVLVAAHRVHGRPRWSIAAIADQLAEQLSDPYAASHDDCAIVSAALSRSYQMLAPLPAQVLRAIGAVRPERISAAEVAELVGLPLHQAYSALDALDDVSLIVDTEDENHYRLPSHLVGFLALRAAHSIDGDDAVMAMRARWDALTAARDRTLTPLRTDAPCST
ncbi:BTAD domain-containing putative transcriptional regulator [Actinoplanes sp. M2I2]|uniref:AfsR/SARP family transcriptional regulator n=1 Tax=Actinoplanes sp. M2I2 TaxID=1734444 RepID=UPI0020219E82|nr:BTAD domain-containing putative transcriptional regulator [Actinoplanes sp. M2I2]